ncbi:MAG: PilZ domain-containing protein [Planctomycetota bacterium]
MTGKLLSREFQDTTGLDDEQWCEMAPRLNEQFADCHLDPKAALTSRIDLRHRSPMALPVYALFRMQCGNWMPYTVRCRDLSTNGIGLYHGGFMHPDTRCYILFKEKGKSSKLLGRVRHCVLLTGKIHLIGVQFDAPIDLRTYLPLLKAAPPRTRVTDSIAGMVCHEDEAAA